MCKEGTMSIIEQAVEDFGSVVREYRVKNFMTYAELSEICSCSSSFIFRVEKHRRFPSLDFRIRFLEQVLGFTTDDIFLFLQKYMDRERMKREIK